MKIIIATGGTGGHIFPGVAIAEELKARGIQVLMVASKFGMEPTIIKNKYPLTLTCQKPLLGKKLKEKLLFPLFLKISFLQSLYILIRERPNAVIGTGGFGSFSVVFVASLLGIPTIITEIDSIPGLATKTLSRFVSEVWLAFENAKNVLPTKKLKLAGFPVRKEITKVAKSIKDFGLSDQKTTVFVFGGSHGAHKVNEIFEKTLDLLPDFQFIWQTGDWKPPITRPNVWTSQFIEDMGSAYGNVELVVSRAGALTIGEIAAVGIPSILIPYPHAASKHQLLNAKILEENGAASVILEKDLTPSVLTNKIIRITKNKELLSKMKKAIKKFHTPETAKLIAERALELCGSKMK